MHGKNHARARRNGGAYVRGAHEERFGVDVNQDRRGSAYDNGGDRRIKGIGLRDDFVAAADSERAQDEDERIRAAADGTRLRDAKIRSKGFLELRDLRSTIIVAANQNTSDPAYQRVEIVSELRSVIVAADVHCVHYRKRRGVADARPLGKMLNAR